MKKILSILPFLIMLISFESFSQNIQLKGKVVDDTKSPIVEMTVYLSKAKDSTLIQ